MGVILYRARFSCLFPGSSLFLDLFLKVLALAYLFRHELSLRLHTYDKLLFLFIDSPAKDQGQSKERLRISFHNRTIILTRQKNERWIKKHGVMLKFLHE